jgi:transketolase C-terminal domain/subunit
MPDVTIMLQDGVDLTLVTTGQTLKCVTESASLLVTSGIHASVISVPFLKPMDAHALVTMMQPLPLVVTIEEHIITGRLRSVVAEVFFSARSSGVNLVSFGILPSSIESDSGTTDDHIFVCASLSAEYITNQLFEVIQTNE